MQINVLKFFCLFLQVSFVDANGKEDLAPVAPFRVTFPKVYMTSSKSSGSKRKEIRSGGADGNVEKASIIVQAYVPPDPGPYPQDKPKQNSVRFTPVQVYLKFS